MSSRNRELIGLIPATLLLTAGFAAVFIQRSNQLSTASLTFGAVFLALCLAGHIFLRMTLPHADPYIFPLVALLASFGLVEIYRIDETLARQQAQWFVLGLLLFEGGKVLTAYMQHGRAPRHALAVAVTFIAVGFIVLAMINILGVLLASYNLNAALWPIYLSIAVAIFLVVTGGLSYRTREPRSETVEDG